MNLIWYANRLGKMNFLEVCKRIIEYLGILHSRIKYRSPEKWPYYRFAVNDISLVIQKLPRAAIDDDYRHYQIYNFEFDLTKTISWHFSGKGNILWPDIHYSRINYRPGNPFGDIRINWELNRLQFLPTMAMKDEELAKKVLADWCASNPYLRGPGYISSMEVALRWISIYRTICFFKKPLEKSFRRELAGLAVASGKFIESRLSTYSSAGNHLIVEAVGLFWVGKAIENSSIGVRWKNRARKILWQQIQRQINPEGTNQEQCFWYLGFVLDAIYQYLILEKDTNIPQNLWDRLGKILEFLDDMVFSDGSFPDYGDRDDGIVFRLYGDYKESLFLGLLNIGVSYFRRFEWYRDDRRAQERMAFSVCEPSIRDLEDRGSDVQFKNFDEPQIKTYPRGGITSMRWGKGRLLFFYGNLGLPPTFGHGHAHALSILFNWERVPVLIDLGSGQYNGRPAIREFFRSTIAHNTVEVDHKNQAELIGPFMWDRSYKAKLLYLKKYPFLMAEASHDGYFKDYSIIHSRKVKWLEPNRIEVFDSFSGNGNIPIRQAFHLGDCQRVTKNKNSIEADFGNFSFSISFLPAFSPEIYFGSHDPFMGWKSAIYGKWEPIHSIIFSTKLQKNAVYKTILKIAEK